MKELMSKINENLKEEELLQLGIDAMKEKFADGRVEPSSFINAFAFSVERKRPEFHTKLKLFQNPSFWLTVFQGYLNYERVHWGTYLMGLVELLSDLFILDFNAKIKAFEILSPALKEKDLKDGLFEWGDVFNFNDVFLRCFRIISEETQANAAAQIAIYDTLNLYACYINEKFQISTENKPILLSEMDFFAELSHFCQKLECPEEAEQLGFSFSLSAIPIECLVKFFSEIFITCKEFDIVDSFNTEMDFFLWKHKPGESKPNYYPTFIQAIDVLIKSFPDSSKISMKYYTNAQTLVNDLTFDGREVLFNIVFDHIIVEHSDYRSIRLPLELLDFLGINDWHTQNRGLKILNKEVRSDWQFFAMTVFAYSENGSPVFEIPEEQVENFDLEDIGNIAATYLLLYLESFYERDVYYKKIDPYAVIKSISDRLAEFNISWSLGGKTYYNFVMNILETWILRTLLSEEKDRVFRLDRLFKIAKDSLTLEDLKKVAFSASHQYIVTLKKRNVPFDIYEEKTKNLHDEIRKALDLKLPKEVLVEDVESKSEESVDADYLKHLNYVKDTLAEDFIRSGKPRYNFSDYPPVNLFRSIVYLFADHFETGRELPDLTLARKLYGWDDNLLTKFFRRVCLNLYEKHVYFPDDMPLLEVDVKNPELFDGIVNTIIGHFGHFKPLISENRNLDECTNQIIFCMNHNKNEKPVHYHPDTTIMPLRFYDFYLVKELYEELFLYHAKELEVYTEIDGDPITEVKGRQLFLEKQLGILLRDPEWFDKIKDARYTIFVQEALRYLMNLRKKEKRTSPIYKDVEDNLTTLIGTIMSDAMLADQRIPFSRDAFQTPVTLDIERTTLRICIRKIMKAKEIGVEEAWKIVYHYLVFWGLKTRSRKETILKEI